MTQGTEKMNLGRFESADSFLSGLDPEAVAELLTAAADIVLVLDAEGRIRDLSLASPELVNLGCRDWQGQVLSATVTVESRPKLEALIKEALAGRRSTPRQVNHPLPTGIDLAVSYRVVSVPRAGRHAGEPILVALGRDLRPDMALQQRLVGAQVSMERDYWRLRHVETRYRLLFQQATEPVLILDATTDKLEEANPAAQALFGDAMRKSSWTLADSLDPAAADAVREAFVRVRTGGRAELPALRLARGGDEFKLSLSLFRQETSSSILVRLSAARATVPPEDDGPQLSELLQQAPDAFVVTDLEGLVLRVNRAFLDLTQAASDDMVRGESLDRWLGRSGVDLNVLVSNLRQHGSVRLFATQLRGEHGGATDVEISAVAALSATPPCLGFTIRDIGRRLVSEGAEGRELPRSPDQMTELVGRVPLKDIVRDTTDLIEQLCIEAALKLTSDNRASAAEMLGLSRQSLYVKLRRYGMGDSPADDES
ncbi:MAG: transcriptional regulator PpsR [Pseudomonadota bacterium]|jgi:transcriptional regulator PpsR